VRGSEVRRRHGTDFGLLRQMPVPGRAEITSRSRSGAQSARNLDVSEHAHMLSGRSERGHAPSGVAYALMEGSKATLRASLLRLLHGRARGSDATAGADAGTALGPDFQSEGGVAPPRTLTFWVACKVANEPPDKRLIAALVYLRTRSEGCLRGHRTGWRCVGSRWPPASRDQNSHAGRVCRCESRASSRTRLLSNVGPYSLRRRSRGSRLRFDSVGVRRVAWG